MNEKEVISIAKVKWYGIQARAGIKENYLDVKVDERWVGEEGRNNFVDWTLGQWRDGYFHEGYEVDKDIVGDSKNYSPDHCCLVPAELNMFFVGTNLNDPHRLACKMHKNIYGMWTFSWNGYYATYCDYEIDAYEDYLQRKEDKLFYYLDKYEGKLHPDVVKRCRSWAANEYDKFILLKISEFF